MANIKSTRQWDKEEKHLLIDLVEIKYDYLFHRLKFDTK